MSKKKHKKKLTPRYFVDLVKSQQAFVKYAIPEDAGMTVEFTYMDKRYRGTVHEVKEQA